jgi:hypothetical protein
MPIPDLQRRRFRLTPGHCLVALLAVEFLLFLSQWFRWLPKGWPVLIAVAAVGVVMLGMFAWFAMAVVLGRRFQFSLRSLLLLTVVAAIGMSWGSVRLRHVRKQRETVTAIRAIGGGVNYDCDSVGRGPPGPAWLRRLLGQEFFAEVVSVDFSGAHHFPIPADPQSDAWYPVSPQSDAWIEVDAYTGEDGPVTDDTIAQLLNGLDRLRELDLSSSGITDAGLDHVRTLNCLEYLNLEGTAITDAGLERLRNMTQLRTLELSGAKVTDEGILEFLQAVPDCYITKVPAIGDNGGGAIWGHKWDHR